MHSLGTDFDGLLTRAAVGALGAAGAWLLVVVVSVALEAHSGGRVRLADRTGCPQVLRAWLLCLFLAVITTFGGPAVAAGTPSGSGDGDRSVRTALDGLRLPDRATGTVRHQAPHRASDSVRVRAGDSLWSIARATLPADPTEREVAAAVRALYARNRQAIGSDPDLILPGLRLLLAQPTSPDPSTRLSEDR